MKRLTNPKLVLLMGMVVAFFGLPMAEAQTTTRSGGRQEQIIVRSHDDPVTTTSESFSSLAKAKLRWTVPDGDRDLLVVRFSAECRLIQGDGAEIASEWVELRARIASSVPVSGYPKFLEPYDTGSPMAFCSDDRWAMQSATWFDRVPSEDSGVTYTVKIQWRTNDDLNTAWLDDWVMELEVAN